MATDVYNRGAARVLAGTTLLGSSPIKAMLVGPGFDFDAEDNFVADIVAEEVAGTGYAGGFAGAGRKTLATPVITEVDGDEDGLVAKFTCASFAWTGLDVGEVAGVVLYHSITSDALSPLLSFHAIDGGDLATDGSDVTLNIPTDGLLRLVRAA